MFFALGVNSAQARLDVDRRLFRSNYRQPARRAGKPDTGRPQRGCAAEPAAMVCRMDPITTGDWKITPRAPEIRNALSHAGWAQLADC